MPATIAQLLSAQHLSEKPLAFPGAITLAGVPIDLTKITVPNLFVSAIEDHMRRGTTTRGHSFLSGKSRFVLSGSGT